MNKNLREEKKLAGQISGGRSFQAEKIAGDKTSGQEHSWQV